MPPKDPAPQAVVRAGIEPRTAAGREVPCVLVHERGWLHQFDDEPGTSEIPTSDHTIDLDGIRSSKTELLIATRSVSTDLMQAMGRAECWQIDADGRLRHRYFDLLTAEQRLRPWAEHEGLDLSDETPTAEHT